jgi:proton-coupled amino acid transporter
MKEPHKFPKVITGVMFFLTRKSRNYFSSAWCQWYRLVLFGGAGALGYLTFGKDIRTVVLVNLDPKNKMVLIVSVMIAIQTSYLTLLFQVQFFYALAILLSVPLQLFPAVRIIENGLFTRSGKANLKVKWMKNMLRFGMVMLCTLISSYGSKDLDKFVAFIGCFAWYV